MTKQAHATVYQNDRHTSGKWMAGDGLQIDMKREQAKEEQTHNFLLAV